MRQFDLETRLFKYRCSYLIYSAAFENLPGPVKERLYRGLFHVLSAADVLEPFHRIPQTERKAILEIIRDTKQGLPEYWK